MARLRDPIKYGFYCVDYENDFGKRTAVAWTLEEAQSIMMYLAKKGVITHKLYEYRPRAQIIAYNKRGI